MAYTPPNIALYTHFLNLGNKKDAGGVFFIVSYQISLSRVRQCDACANEIGVFRPRREGSELYKLVLAAAYAQSGGGLDGVYAVERLHALYKVGLARVI